MYKSESLERHCQSSIGIVVGRFHELDPSQHLPLSPVSVDKTVRDARAVHETTEPRTVIVHDEREFAGLY